MKFLDLFAGVGGFRLGMEQANHECVGYVEWDKFARASYEAIHYTKGEWTAHDIRTVSANDIRGLGADCWCFGFPCQDISIAGKQQGFEGNRSSLFFTVTKLIRDLEEENRPKYLFIENVKNLLSVNGGIDFAKLLIELDDIGYDAEWQVLNSKNFGVPQNRERVFIIGHIRVRSGRKVFPIGGCNGEIIKLQGQQSNAITARYGQALGSGTDIGECQQHEKSINVVGKLDIKGDDYIKRVYGTDGLSPALPTMQGGKQEPKILVREATKKGYTEAFPGDSINLAVPGSETRRGRVGKGIANTLDTSCNQGVLVSTGVPFVDKKYKVFYDKNGYVHEMFNPYNCSEIKENAPTLTAQGESVTKSSTVLKYDGFRIRKLTPLECWRLQGFPDWAFEKAAKVNSNSQLYKQAGNSVTVNVIYEIAKRL